jgi:hypothetical protein
MSILQPKQLQQPFNFTGSMYGTASYAITASYAMNGGTAESVFLRNQTNENSTDVILVNQSIFNPSNLTVLSSSIFIISDSADYYVLGDIINSGSIHVSGTLKVGGNIYLGPSGSIVGPGIIT